MTRDEARFREEIFDKKVYGEPVKGLVVDIGSHIGLFVEYMHESADMIYAIEPARNNYEELVGRTKDWPNVKCFNVAIGDRESIVSLYEGASDGAWSLDGQVGWSGDSQEVTMTTLEGFINRQGIDHIDLLKIDCEGCEQAVILAPEFKDIAHRIDVVVGELHGGRSADILKELGFDVTYDNQIFRAERKK